ncbi:MAG: HEAT repeat domain-containing protein [Spirochaetes bacterium]|nr:HEAT repeat domain-containing protein [Spirochaetota bacterium]
MKERITYTLIITCLLLPGCGLFQKAEIVRIQKQREAANRYAGGNWMERRDAVRDIVNYFGKGKNDLVIGTLLVGAQDPHPSVRIEAVTGLARIKTEQTIPIIKHMASEEKDGNVRWYALKALQSIDDPSRAEIFMKGLESDDWLIREESVRGITGMDELTIRARLIPSIVKAINDKSSSVALIALRTIKIKDDRLYSAITARLASCSPYDYSLLEASLIALRGYKLDPKIKEKVVNLLVHNNKTIRVLALRVLKKEKAITAPTQ